MVVNELGVKTPFSHPLHEPQERVLVELFLICDPFIKAIFCRLAHRQCGLVVRFAARRTW